MTSEEVFGFESMELLELVVDDLDSAIFSGMASLEDDEVVVDSIIDTPLRQLHHHHHNLVETRIAVIANALLLVEMETDEDVPKEDEAEITIKRKPKVVRTRKESWEFVLTWDLTLFQRQFRVSRETFFRICERCKAIYPGKSDNGYTNYQLAIIRGGNSTPVSGPITIEIKLAITLRLLAGASYLDLVWYGVHVNSIHPIFKFTLLLLHKAFPYNEIFNFDPYVQNFSEEIQKIAFDWSSIMIRKKGFDLFKGTILAGDGLFILIVAPSANDRKGLDLAAFRNRKGCFAVNV